jgi:hypothetical protein
MGVRQKKCRRQAILTDKFYPISPGQAYLLLSIKNHIFLSAQDP